MVSERTAIEMDIRWMIRRDMAEVFAISEETRHPLEESEAITLLRQRNCIGMVADHKGDVAGFMIYYLQKPRLLVHTLAVKAEYRRCGVGTRMIEKLKGKLNPDRRRALDMHVPDDVLSMHLFLKAMGFVATGVVDGDLYHFTFRI